MTTQAVHQAAKERWGAVSDSHADHLDATTIAELDAGALDPTQAESARAHLRSCPGCAGVRAGLAEVQAVLASTPAPAMPDDVAARLDTVLAESSARRTSGAGRAATVTALPVRRRWLAPLVAAATVATAVAVGGEVLQTGLSGSDEGAVSDSEVAGSAQGEADDDAGDALRRDEYVARLSSESFALDVERKVIGAEAGDLTDVTRRAEADAILRDCTEGLGETASYAGNPRPVLLDGRPALLFLSGPRDDRLAVAVSCDEPTLEVRARLRLQ